jgi:CheY-like chemotaxis protein
MKDALKILVAEDQPDDLFLLRQAFKKAQFTSAIYSVCDGVEAQAYLSGESDYSDRSIFPFPDVLLLDLNMPRMNGFDLLAWLREDPRCKRLVVHVLSSSVREVDVRRAYDLGANSYITKPSRLDELVAFANALLCWHEFVLVGRPAATQEPPRAWSDAAMRGSEACI